MKFENSYDGRNIDDFKKIATLGRGTFATVYKV